jgi:hypothetical protein
MSVVGVTLVVYSLVRIGFWGDNATIQSIDGVVQKK